MAEASARWSGRELKEIRDAIDSFWIRSRGVEPRPDFSVRFAAVLSAKRTEIVLMGLDEKAARAEQRRDAAKATRLHAETSGVWGRATAEISARFAALEARREKERARAERLSAKVRAGGLPAEAASYDPAAPR